MRIGIFGGSFNPPHNGHIAIGRFMLSYAKLDEVWYMVSPQNPLKCLDKNLAPEELRLKMVTMALKGEEKLKPCDYEFYLPRPSYTWNTLQHLRKDFPQHEFVLLIGDDNWKNFNRWAHYEDIKRTTEIAVYPRYATNTDIPLYNISSTEIRERISRGEDVSKLLPKEVAKEVEKNALYR